MGLGSKLLDPTYVLDKYIYIYLDSRYKGEYLYWRYKFKYKPIYIGMGIKNRYLDHFKEVNKKRNNNNLFYNTLAKLIRLDLSPIIFKLKENLTREEAIFWEVFFIDLIGRKNIRKGPLLNITKGGFGGSARKATKIKVKCLYCGKEELVSLGHNANKRKFCNKKCYDLYQKGKPSPMKGRIGWSRGLTRETDSRLANIGNAIKGGHLSEEQKTKMSDSHKGKKFSKEHKENISKAKKGKKLSIEHKKNISKGNRGKQRTKEMKEKYSKVKKGSYKNFKWVTNGYIIKHIRPEEFINYLENGWILGKKKYKIKEIV